MFRRLTFWLVLVVLVLAAPRATAAGKKLSPELAADPWAIVPPGISHLAWRPGADEVSYVRPQGSQGSEETGLYLYDASKRRERLLLKAGGETSDLDLSSYQWSPTGDAILFSGGNDLWVYDVASGHAKRLTHDSAAEEHASFSPSGDRVAFVKNNDLYEVDVSTDQVTRLTEDGSPTIYNGKLDWVYEEEMANRATSPAYVWSPDGENIAYLRLDDGPVPQYPITSYLSTHVSLYEQRFPQAGDANPVPSLHVVNAGPGKRGDRAFPLSAGAEYIGPNFSWTPDSKEVAILTLNRNQDDLRLHEWQPETGNDRVLLEEKDPYWVNSLDAPYFLKNSRRFLWLSERDGWMHLYLYDDAGKLVKKLTSGDWMIDHPVFSDVPMFQVDEAGGWVYFSSTDPDPRQRQVWRAGLDGSGLQCLTKQAGTHTFDLSPDGRYFTDRFSDIATPPATLLLESNGAFAATLDKPENDLSAYDLGKFQLVTVKARDGATLYARLLKPPDFDPNRKYPVVVYVYGGPHVQMVTDGWSGSSLLDQLFAQEGFLVWTLDNRGSWGRGHSWESVIFEHMGRHELQDQLAGIDYLKSLPYVDASRIGIHGWSYGGYMTLYALTHAPDVFKCGAAGGPVTAWKFYDSIYTERYMRTPEQNPDGYKDSSPLFSAANLRGKVLLIHGADDDNVHMQNTMNFVNALVDLGKPFELYIQPGQKHGFRGVTVNTYLDQRMLDFFKKNL